MAALENDVMMARFRRDYLALLDVRVLSIVEELEAGNTMNAHVALLSLESSSSMIGARALSEVVAALRSAVESGQRAQVPELVTAMIDEAEQMRVQLRRAAGDTGLPAAG